MQKKKKKKRKESVEESIEYLVLRIAYRIESTRYLKSSRLSPVIRILDNAIFNFLNGTRAASRAVDQIRNISDTTIRSSIRENYDRIEESKEIDVA